MNGSPLIAEAEYKLDADRQTVRLTKKLDVTDDVVITSIESGAHELIGFRIFYDNFGRTHYKRISGLNMTQLVSDITPTDTSITVLDGSVLTPPDLANRIPGVILVDGERIEFYQLIGNELTQLKRGALGTGIKNRHVSGTTVVDQGVGQTIRIVDTPQTQILPTDSQENISSVAVITSSTPAVIKVPLVVTTTSTVYTRGIVSSVLGNGSPIKYTISPNYAPGYTTIQPFDYSANTVVGHIPTAGEEAWFVMSEISVGGTGKENKKWFTNLQTSVASTGTTSQVYLSFATTSGGATYVVDTVFAGDVLENSIKAFSTKTAIDPKSGFTSTIWYIKGSFVTPQVTNAVFEAGQSVFVNWSNIYTGPTQYYSIPHTVVNTTVIKDGQTATTTVFTSTEILSTGTIFELTGIDFRGTANDVSRQVSVYYQGRQLKNSIADIQSQNVNIAYDSGEINSVGVNSTDIVPNEYQITQYLGRYFLEVFIPVSVASELKIVKNSTQVWYDINSNSSLTDQNTEQIRFLRSSPARLPDKYLYGQNTDSIPVYVEELGGTIDSETGEPLVGE